MLSEFWLVLFVLYNFVIQISSIRVIHYNTETARQVIKKSFFIANHKRVIDWSKYSNLIKRIYLLFLR